MMAKNPKSVYEKIDGIFYLPRMLDKIRLKLAGELGKEYWNNLGKAFDLQSSNLLAVKYERICELVAEGMSDEEILRYALDKRGAPIAEYEKHFFNETLRKYGWSDGEAIDSLLAKRKRECDLVGRDDINTFFDLIEADEGRDLPPACGA